MFKLPEDIKSIAAPELDALLDEVRTYARGIAEATPAASIEEIRNATEAYQAVLEEKTARAEADKARAELAAAVAEPVMPEENVVEETPEVPVAEKAVTATVSTRSNRSTLDAPPEEGLEKHVIMTTATDVPGFGSGIELKSFTAAAEALDNRLQTYPASAPRKGSGGPRQLGSHSFEIHPGRTAIRHGGVMFRRQFPDDLRITEGKDGHRVIRNAAKESRLPGGSLLKSAQRLVDQGRALTAAVGWCAPSEVIYNLCDLASMDGLLDLPEIQATRGGFQVPADGGPNFSVVWDGIGDNGDVVLTEYQVENGATKECFEIPCPEFVDVRLDVAYLCLTGSLLQRRGYPEVVEWFSQESIKALAHKVNAAVIASIATASGPATVIPPIAYSDDAASALLSAIDLAIEDMKYRNRIERGRTLEVVLPYWAITQVRAALARRRGILALDVTDRMLLDWFAVRSAMPRFVYDWQDAYTGLVGGPGGASPLTALPTTVNFLVYPAGTWTKIVRDVVNLDTIYDNAMLTTNNYTALFVEDGFNVIQTCPDSRLYTATVNPDGVVGCCETDS